MRPKQTPRITYSPLVRRWFVVTRYIEKTTPVGKRRYLVAREKFDVTDQMQAILAKTSRAAVTRAAVRVEL
jgi:hypothetical protein